VPSRRKAPSYNDLKPASAKASKAARGSSRKKDTKPEVVLRKVLWARGYRYRKDVAALRGRPDVVFAGAKVAVFCDGDFWHGRDWRKRRRKLERGHNPEYWIAKIKRNMERDRKNTRELEKAGWLVLRFWETDILRDPEAVADQAIAALSDRGDG
jgi:DNA mismatch endonuclease (patch repair protein)